MKHAKRGHEPPVFLVKEVHIERKHPLLGVCQPLLTWRKTLKPQMPVKHVIGSDVESKHRRFRVEIFDCSICAMGWWGTTIIWRRVQCWVLYTQWLMLKRFASLVFVLRICQHLHRFSFRVSRRYLTVAGRWLRPDLYVSLGNLLWVEPVVCRAQLREWRR